MKVVYYVIVSLIFILLQTIVLPGSFFFSRCFDLIVVIVLHISLNYTNPGVLAGTVVLGCIMDSISGGPLGLYISAYVWIFVLVQICKGFVHSENVIFLFIVSGAAVLVENGFQIFTFMVQGGGSVFSSSDLGKMAQQVLWALIIIPFFMVALTLGQRAFLRLTVNRYAKGPGLNR